MVIVSHDMDRELPRTIRSLSPGMQWGIDADRYELIVVDNGSARPPDRSACEAFGARIRWLRVDDAPPSPVRAVNLGIAAASAPLVGAMVDGARLASPGLLRLALTAARLHPRPLIATLSFHLGPDVQRRSVVLGYDAAAEDAMLEEIDWTGDGYRLFEVSALAESSRSGWFEAPGESNALFMGAGLWRELGAYDERFRAPGGGFANPDLFERACRLPGSQLVILLGEATFHQVHGGAVTNSPRSAREQPVEEYRRLRGHQFRKPGVMPVCLGSPRAAAAGSIAASARADSAEPAEGAAAGAAARRYIKLLKRALLDEAGLAVAATAERRQGQGRRKWLHAIDRCVSTVLFEHVDGDLVQHGLGNPGAPILMRGVLAAWKVGNRTVWVVDRAEDLEATGLDELRAGLEHFDLLDEQVRFLTPAAGAAEAQAAIARIAVLRLERTAGAVLAGALTELYDRVAAGGFVIVAGYGEDPECRRVVDGFRAARGIADPMLEADAGELRWRKG